MVFWLFIDDRCPALEPMPLCGSLVSLCESNDDCPVDQRCCLSDVCVRSCVPAIPALPTLLPGKSRVHVRPLARAHPGPESSHIRAISARD